MRERLNGYYGVSQFTVANTLASLPFIFIIAVLSSMAVYWISGLNSSGGSVIYFILALFMSLVVTEASSHAHTHGFQQCRRNPGPDGWRCLLVF